MEAKIQKSEKKNVELGQMQLNHILQRPFINKPFINSSKKTKNKTCWMVYFQGLAFYTCLDLAVTKLLKRSGKRKLQLKQPRSQKNLRGHPARHQLTTHSAYVNSLQASLTSCHLAAEQGYRERDSEGLRIKNP